MVRPPTRVSLPFRQEAEPPDASTPRLQSGACPGPCGQPRAPAPPAPNSDPEALAEFRANNDPLEPLNRGVFFVNRALDTMFIAPISEFYRYLVPWPIRQVVRNGLANLREPVTLANDVLQGNMGRAGDTASRFLLNSTVGLAGAFDVATDFGHPRQREGFEDTFAVWGAGEGPFLMLPLLGPSNVRDTVGYVADWFADRSGPTSSRATRAT